MSQEIKILSDVYSESEALSKMLNSVLPKVKNTGFRKIIINHINEFDKINSDAKCEMSNLGKKMGSNFINNISITVGAKISTMCNSSESFISELIIKEANRKSIKLSKETNKAQDVDTVCHTLAQKLIKKIDECISSIKIYL